MLASRATEPERPDLDTNRIKEWRSIVTLIVFVLTSKSSENIDCYTPATNLEHSQTSMCCFHSAYQFTSPGLSGPRSSISLVRCALYHRHSTQPGFGMAKPARLCDSIFP